MPQSSAHADGGSRSSAAFSRPEKGAVWAFIGFMGGVGLFAIEKAADGFLIYSSPDFIYSLRPIPLVHFHSLVLISVALALIDFVAYRSPLELALSDYAVEQAAARKGIKGVCISGGFCVALPSFSTSEESLDVL